MTPHSAKLDCQKQLDFHKNTESKTVANSRKDALGDAWSNAFVRCRCSKMELEEHLSTLS